MSWWQCVCLGWCDKNSILSLWPSFPLPIRTRNNGQIMRKTSNQSQRRDILQNTWAVLLRTVRVIEKSLRNHHSQGALKETWCLNVMWFPHKIWEQKKGLRLKTKIRGHRAGEHGTGNAVSGTVTTVCRAGGKLGSGDHLISCVNAQSINCMLEANNKIKLFKIKISE